MLIAAKIAESMERSSWIRRMFEEGAKLKAQYGAENVYDFSLGNPNVPPPEKFFETLRELAAERVPGVHGYMPNAGFPATRAAVAQRVSREQQVATSGDHIVMTTGAGGALNAVLRAILDPGDEILVPRPFFVEYVFYADNHQGVLTTVPTTADFDLDPSAFEAAIGPKTRAVLINTPNNPTGRVYTRDSLKKLADLLARKSAELGRTIFLLSDEPYRAVAFDGVEVPGIFPLYDAALVCSSFSKDLSLAGERVGYIAANPRLPGVETLVAALTMTNRILGFVNAPAFMQRVVAKLQNETVDVDFYKGNRDLLLAGIRDAGIECRTPEGAFYLFAKSPIADDVEFCRALLKENILAVPGTGFHGPGHFRLAYCCGRDVIERSLPAFQRVMEKY